MYMQLPKGFAVDAKDGVDDVLKITKNLYDRSMWAGYGTNTWSQSSRKPGSSKVLTKNSVSATICVIHC